MFSFPRVKNLYPGKDLCFYSELFWKLFYLISRFLYYKKTFTWVGYKLLFLGRFSWVFTTYKKYFSVTELEWMTFLSLEVNIFSLTLQCLSFLIRNLELALFKTENKIHFLQFDISSFAFTSEHCLRSTKPQALPCLIIDRGSVLSKFTFISVSLNTIVVAHLGILNLIKPITE